MLQRYRVSRKLPNLFGRNVAFYRVTTEIFDKNICIAEINELIL